MPFISGSTYSSHPYYLRSRHLETLAPSLLYRDDIVSYTRERIELNDTDFLDLDWIRQSNKRVVVLSAGMEGNSKRHYIQRTAHYFSQRGWDVLAWNYRGCSGEINRLARYYSYADTRDLRAVLEHIKDKCEYTEVALIGFSMGGCQTTTYLGESENYLPTIIASVSFSVSCNLLDSMQETERLQNFIYKNYFISKLKKKLAAKASLHKEIEAIPLERIRSFDDYLRYYNVPFHGFLNVDDFYSKSSCEQFLPSIQVPSLIVNALNDPILGRRCYPHEIARASTNVYLETPATGGHLGFPLRSSASSWMEIRAFEFITHYSNADA